MDGRNERMEENERKQMDGWETKNEWKTGWDDLEVSGEMAV